MYDENSPGDLPAHIQDPDMFAPPGEATALMCDMIGCFRLASAIYNMGGCSERLCDSHGASYIHYHQERGNVFRQKALPATVPA